MKPTFDILLGRLLMHEHKEYESSGGKYLGSFATPADLPAPSAEGDFALVEATGTFWWWDASVPGWVEIGAKTPSSYRKEIRSLTSSEITNAAISLADTPDVSEPVTFTVLGGAPNVRTLSFSVSGSTLSWRGSDMDGILEVGDDIMVDYRI